MRVIFSSVLSNSHLSIPEVLSFKRFLNYIEIHFTCLCLKLFWLCHSLLYISHCNQ